MADISQGLKIGRRIRHMGRLAQITNVFARHGLWTLAETLGIASRLSPDEVRRAKELSREGDAQPSSLHDIHGLPARLRASFEELGPAFVKLGQLLAVREDLLPPSFIEELRKLHSSVAPLPFAMIRKVLDEELGPERLKAFRRIEEKPLAAGSIAQVHEAELESGEVVVIKVQRPGIAQQMEVDLSLMEELAGLLERYIPETGFARPRSMIAEFKRATLGELDFIREAGNIAKMQRNFTNVDFVEIPEVYWKLTTPRVITMSKMVGLGPWDKQALIDAGIEPKKLVERGLSMFLQMVFIDGLLHGDLHPGNVLALPGTRVGIIDLGVTVHLGRAMRENLAGLLIGLVEEDFARAVLHYIELADPAMDFNAEAFEHEIGNALAPFLGLSLEELHSGRLFWDLARIAARHGAPMPQELIVFVRTLISFEGIGNHLDPSFDVLSATKKYTAKIAAEIYSPDKIKQQAFFMARDVAQLAKHAPYQMRRLLRAALEGDLSLNIASDEVARLALALDRSSARLAISLIIGALIIGSSILAFAHVGEKLYSVSVLGLVGFALAGVLAVYVIISILRGDKK